MTTAGDTQRGRDAPGPPLGPTVGLAITLALAGFVLVMATVELLVNPRPLRPPLNLGENQDVETGLFLVTVLVIGPLAAIAAPRVAGRLSAAALSALSALLAGSLAGAILLVRILPGGGVAEALAVVGAWSLLAAAVVARASAPSPWPGLLRLAPAVPYAWAATAVLALAGVLAFTAVGSLSLPGLALGAAAAAAAVAAYVRELHLPRLDRRWRLVIDAALVLLILAAIPDLVIFRSPVNGGPLSPFEAFVFQTHQDLALGPANEVIHGGAMLVGTASQYGIASIYFLAAWFELVPIGHGTLGLLDGVLYALFFAAGYGVLRMAGVGRLLAGSALALGIAILIYNLLYSVGVLVAQHGPLRFGLPMLLIVAAVAEARWPSRAGPARVAQFAVVGLASLWALEAFTYTVVTFAAISCLAAWAREGPGRLAWLARQALLALAACATVHLLFVAGTLIFTGELPDYGWYFGYLNSFLFGEIGDITYDFARWSPGLALGFAEVASAIAFVLLVQRRRDLVARERPALIALCGTTAYGIALFSYFVDRSANHILPYLSLPALLAGTLWLSLLLRGALGGSRAVRAAGLAFALAVSVLLFSVAWSSIHPRFTRSALGVALPGGKSLRQARYELWHLPPLDAREPIGQALLDRYMAGDAHPLVLLPPELETDTLVASDRTNRLGLDYAWGDGFAASVYLPRLRPVIADLRPGTRLLTTAAGLAQFRRLQRRPGLDVLRRPSSRVGLAPIQQWVLQQLGRRFSLRVVHRDPHGLRVVALSARTCGSGRGRACGGSA